MTSVKQMWLHRRRAVEILTKSATMQAMFQAWKHLQQFMTLQRTIQKRGKFRRRQQYQEQVQQAEQAAKRGDQHALYKIIRKLAPKQSYKRVQLRGSLGQLLDPAAELQSFREYCSQLFKADEPAVALQRMCNTYHITAAELQDAILSLRAHKAVPAGCARTLMWHACADILAPILQSICCRMWTGVPTYPDLWSHAWISWLEKARKRVLGPETLRPIALQETGGKAVGKVLQRHLQVYMKDALSTWPQYAYYPGRGLEGALMRATSFCHAVRRKLQQASANLHQRKAGHTNARCTGGALLALDLSKAFDRVSRSDMLSSLQQHGVPHDLQQIVMAVHNNIRYHLRVGEHKTEVSCMSGVRQGCVIAPYLWNLITAAMFCRLSEVIPREVIIRTLTLFADDTLCTWHIDSVDDLQSMCVCIGALFQTLREFGMEINAQKSQFLIELRGRNAKQWLRRHTRHTKIGTCVVIPMPNGTEELLPVVSRIQYLGTMLSYGRFEDENLKHRISCAELQRHRLIRFLHGKHCLGQQHRLSLWRTCVWPSISYSLAVVGLSSKGVTMLSVTFFKHLRAILRMPAHLTGTSNMQILEQVKLLNPVLQLQQTALELQVKTGCSWDCMMTNQVNIKWLDRLNAQYTQHSQNLKAQHMDMATGTSLPQTGDVYGNEVVTKKGIRTADFVCGTCLLSFPTLSALKRHNTISHGQQVPNRQDFSRHKFGHLGMPTCHFCRREFQSWSHLERHIQLNNCEALWLYEQNSQSATQPTDTLQLPMIERPEFLQMLSNGWQTVLQEKDICNQLQSTCLLCNQWIADGKQVKYHLKVKHADVVRAHHDTALQLSKLLLKAGSSPCTWCGTARPDLHVARCSVVYQVALAASITGHTHDGSTHGRGDGRPLRPATVVGRVTRQRDTPGKTSQVTDHSQRGKDQGQGQRQGGLTRFFQVGGDGNHPATQQDRATTRGSVAAHPDGHSPDFPTQEQRGWGLRRPADSDETANEWKRRHQQDPKSVDKSLRQTVLLRLIQELRSRLQLAQSNPQLLQDKGWLNEHKAWVYQQWNPDKQQLKPQGKDAVPMDQLLKQVDEAAKLLKTPDILLKFQSTRPLTSQMTGPVITYLCELALRGEEANRLYTLFRMWAGLSGLLVVGLQVKGPRLQRSAMAQQLQKTVFRPYLHSNLPILTTTAI